MTGYTPRASLPYPEPGDDIRDAPAVFKELATAIDPAVGISASTVPFYGEGITGYTAGTSISVMTFGPLVVLAGIGTASTADARSAISGTSATAANRIAQLPTELRPGGANIYVVAQGSQTAKWLLSITMDGGVYAQRYEGTPPSKPWLNFSAVYITAV